VTDAIQSPTARRKRRSSADIADRILSAAKEEFTRGGFEGTTTAAIARRADVTEAQLFRHYASKAALFQEAVFKPLNQHFCDFHIRNLGDASQVGSQRDKAHGYITELQQFIADHSKMLMSLIVARTYVPGSMQGVGEFDSLRAYFDRGAAMMSQRVEGDAKVAPELMVRVSFAAVLASVMFKDWLFPEGLASDEAIRAAIIDFVIEGVNANADPGLK
jgi:AcrR family transcriptional regulator